MTETQSQPTIDKFYRPSGAAKALFPCRDAEVLIEGPAGTGKTLAVLEKVNRWMLKCPGSRAMIVRKTRASMTESVLVTYETKVVPDNPAHYPDLNAQQRGTRKSYQYPNGSTIVVCGLDDPARIMSTEYDLIAAFEATELTENDWELLTSRLRNGVMPYQQAIADCNPGQPTHWLNQRAERPYSVPVELKPYFPAAREGQKQMTRLLSRHEDNPKMFDAAGGRWTAGGAQYLGTLNRLSGARKLRLLSGKWAAQEGLVYGEFDAAVHIIPRFEIPADWRRFRVVDFGFTNPFVCQWWAMDGDGRMFMYREIYHSQRLVEDHADGVRDAAGSIVKRGIKQYSQGENIRTTVADHDAEDRATLARRGINTIPAKKSIAPGIEAVQARLRIAGDGKPRLFLFTDALVEVDQNLIVSKRPTSTAQEFDGYAYPKGQEGKPVKEDPLKLDDHGMDAMRYAVAYADLGSSSISTSQDDFDIFSA